MANETQKPAEATPSKKGISIITIAMMGVLIVAIGGGAAWFLLRRRPPASAAKAGAQVKPSANSQTIVTVYPLDQFVVNLADKDHPTFVRIGIDLGISKKLDPADTAKDSPFTPELRDSIIGVVSTFQATQLLAPNGKDRLKAQLLSALQKRIPTLDITQVFLTDFIVQE